jgi:hypothetical protein
MAINPTDPAFPGTGPGINVRTYLAASALSGWMARNTGFSAFDAEQLVKATDLVIAELNKGAIGSIGSTGSMGAASSTGNKTLNVGTPSIDVRR